MSTLPTLIDGICEVFNSLCDFVIIPIGNSEVLVDSIGRQTMRKCISRYNMPRELFPIDYDITPENIDDILDMLSRENIGHIILDSAIGQEMNICTLSTCGAYVCSLSEPKLIGDASILVSTVTDKANMSSLDIIHASDILSYALWRAYKECKSHYSPHFLRDYSVPYSTL